MALQSGAFERLREFSSPGVLVRTLLLHVARGYSLRETVVRAKLAHWADVSDVALLVALLTEKLIQVGATFPPGATQSRHKGPPNPWREFSFALHQIQQAIEPHLPLRQTLFSWNQIAQALTENSRNRSLQLAKWRIK